jgi:hypothetical protein
VALTLRPVPSIHRIAERSSLLGNRPRSSHPEEEKPEHHPDEGYHQDKGRQKESYHSHVPTVTKERPGGFRRGVSTKD